MAGGGIPALHWNMLSWLELGYSRVLRGLRLRRVGRAVNGGCMLVFFFVERLHVLWVVSGGSLVELAALCRRALLYGLGVWELGVGWFGVGVWVGVCVVLLG